MLLENKIFMAQSDKNLFLLPGMANRHGLIAGATGTGKTVTMKVMAESFSEMGVSVFLADVKGDLSGMCQPGVLTEDMQSRIERFGLEDFRFQAYPTRFWDIFGEKGHPVRVTVSEIRSPFSSSATLTSRCSESASRLPTSGKPRPVSQREIALSETCSSPPSCDWVSPRSLRIAAMNSPVFCVFMGSPPGRL